MDSIKDRKIWQWTLGLSLILLAVPFIQIQNVEARSLYAPCMQTGYEDMPVTWTVSSDDCLRWDHQHITYYLVNRNETLQEQSDMIDSAFQEWQRATDRLLTFGRTSSPLRADIYIAVESESGTMFGCQSMMVIEGCSGVLYTGVWIEKGMIILNRDGVDFYTTTIHEIGHVLALDHSIGEDFKNPIDMMYCCGRVGYDYEISYLGIARLQDIYAQD